MVDGVPQGRRDVPRCRDGRHPPRGRPLDDGAIADWNVCDWYAVKVLAPLCRRDGARFARPLAAWSASGSLWHQRAPAAAFATLAGGPTPFPEFTALCVEVCAALVVDRRRFAQTAVGWLLRELAKREPDWSPRSSTSTPRGSAPRRAGWPRAEPVLGSDRLGGRRDAGRDHVDAAIAARAAAAG